jgi:hypothetical protein
MGKIKINIASTVFDVILILYVAFFLYGAITKGRDILSAVDPVSGIIVSLLLMNVMPYYLGKTWGQLKDMYEPLQSAPVSVLSFMVYVPTLIFLFAGSIAVGNRSGLLQQYEWLVVLGGVAAISIGGLLGYLESLVPGDTNYEKATSRNKTAIWISFVCLMALLIIPVTIHEPLKKTAGTVPAVMIEIAASIGIVALGIMLFKFFGARIDHVSQKVAEGRYSGRIVEGILAFLVITLVCLWYELLIDFIVSGHVSFFGMVYIITVTGYLPLRILMEFKPPFTPVNIVTGTASIAYFLYEIIKSVSG